MGITRDEYKGDVKRYDMSRLLGGIKTRCLNKNRRTYPLYGGRGVTMCPEWQDKKEGLNNFIKDMGFRPEGKYPSGMPKWTIDRIDNNKGYCKDNCRWATSRTQVVNRRGGLQYIIDHNRQIAYDHMKLAKGYYKHHNGFLVKCQYKGIYVCKYFKLESDAINYRKEFLKKFNLL